MPRPSTQVHPVEVTVHYNGNAYDPDRFRTKVYDNKAVGGWWD